MTDCNQDVIAVHAVSPPAIDGRLDDAVWEAAPRYEMMRSREQIAQRPGYRAQAGAVQFAWDADHLYVAARFEDDDVIARGEADNLPHFQLGDTFELFLKPIGQTHYWEMYATPRGRQSLMRLEAAGLVGLPGNRLDLDPILEVGVTVDGTLNNGHDRDRGWTAELAIPLNKLDAAAGGRLQPGLRWQILVARYNYGRYQQHRGPELTMYPQLSRPSFHDVWEYANLRFEGSPQGVRKPLARLQSSLIKGTSDAN